MLSIGSLLVGQDQSQTEKKEKKKTVFLILTRYQTGFDVVLCYHLSPHIFFIS